MKYGIDISHWQGAVDFSKVNVDFVIMKLSQNQSKDPKFDTYYNAYNGPKGCYIYNKVGTPAQAMLEAEYAVKRLNGKTVPMGVWLDMEDASMRKLGKNVLSTIIDTEATILQKAGYSVGIYCNKDWYVNVLDSKFLSQLYPFWIARYPANDNGTVKESLNPKNYNNCVMWQYSSKGSIPGIKGNVDMDIILDEVTKTGQNEVIVKTVDQLAKEVIKGYWATGTTRKLLLEQAGYNYNEVQAKVNELLKK